MKWIPIIFVFYLTALSVMPCTDDWKEAETHHEWSEEGSDDCGEDCSPLCSCQCCHINVFVHTSYVDVKSTFTYHEFEIQWLTEKPSTTSNALFRPPQYLI